MSSMHYHIKITQVKIHTDAYNTKEINKTGKCNNMHTKHGKNLFKMQRVMCF